MQQVLALPTATERNTKQHHMAEAHKMIPLKRVAEMVGIHRVTLFRWIKRGWGPRIRHLPNGRPAVREDEAAAWIATFMGTVEAE